MIRRFVSGLVWGGVVAFAGLAVISQVAPHPAVVTGDDDISVPTDPAAPVAETSTVPEQPVVADDAPVDAADKEPAPAEPDPQTESTPPAIPDSDAPAAPVSPDVTSDSPATIPAESSPERSTPAAPAAATAADAVPDAGDLPPPAPEVAESDLLAPLPEKQPEAPDSTPAADDNLPDADAPRMAENGAAAAADPSVADAGNPPEPAPAGSPPTPAPDAPVPDVSTKPRILTPDPADGLPGIAANDAPLDPPAPAASALPQIGTSPDTAPGTDLSPTEILPADILPDDLPPIAAFARPFDNPEAKPLFAILLVDDGNPAIDRKSLAELPFPVTFVVDPNAPNAAEAAAIYRSGLQEVVMAATGLPADAKPEDVEQSFGANASSLPETVAVIDLYKDGFQDDRALASAIVPILQDQGRGLITYDHGLNAADQVARRDALPAAKVFRVLDAENESAPTMRRYLDRAAFKAAQEGSVVVIGQAMPDTVAAILEWSVEGRAASVTLAPVTAVLNAP